MSIFKKEHSKYWHYAVRNGKKYLRGTTGTEDEAVARAVEQTIKSALNRTMPADRLHAMIDALAGKRGGNEGLMLAGIWPEYERYCKSTGVRLVEGTERQRRRICERFATWAGTSYSRVTTVEQVDRECAAAFAAWLASTGTSGKTRANLLGDLGTVWKGLQCVRNAVKENPWGFVRPAKDGEHGKAFSRDEEARVIAAADRSGNGWGLACRIARYTGLRYGDVARLRWDQVDLDKRVIRLTPSKTARKKIQVVMPIANPLMAALENARREMPFSEFVLPEHAECYPRPKRGAPRPFSEAVLTPAGLDGKGFTFHSWRHTFRTRLAEAGVSDDTAKRLGGWTEDSTAKIYDHSGVTEQMRKAVEACAE